MPRFGHTVHTRVLPSRAEQAVYFPVRGVLYLVLAACLLSDVAEWHAHKLCEARALCLAEVAPRATCADFHDAMPFLMGALNTAMACVVTNILFLFLTFAQERTDQRPGALEHDIRSHTRLTVVTCTQVICCLNSCLALLVVGFRYGVAPTQQHAEVLYPRANEARAAPRMLLTCSCATSVLVLDIVLLSLYARVGVAEARARQDTGAGVDLDDLGDLGDQHQGEESALLGPPKRD